MEGLPSESEDTPDGLPSESEDTPDGLPSESESEATTEVLSELPTAITTFAPPSDVIFREEYLVQCFDFLRDALSDRFACRTLYLYGPSGSGKTHCIKNVQSHLRSAFQNFHIVYIDFFYQLIQPSDVYEKILGSHHHTREEFYEFLNGETEETFRVIIADNLDRCVGNEGNDWQELLTEMCDLTSRRFLLLGTGRKMLSVDFTRDHRIQPVAFSSYEGEQLTHILEQNIEEMGIIFEANARLFLAEKFRLNNGYLRALKPICTLSIDKAKALNKNQVELVEMTSAFGEIDFVLKNISGERKPVPSKLLYKAIVTVLYGNGSDVSLNDLEQVYQRICMEAVQEPRNYNQIKAMCSRFKTNGGIRVENHHVHAGPLVLETISAGVQGEFT